MSVVNLFRLTQTSADLSLQSFRIPQQLIAVLWSCHGVQIEKETGYIRSFIVFEASRSVR